MAKTSDQPHHPRSEIGLAELVEALHHLQPADEPTRFAIAEALGLAEYAAAKSAIRLGTGGAERGAAEEPSAGRHATETELANRIIAQREVEDAKLRMLTPISEEAMTIEVLFGASAPGEVEPLEPSSAAQLQAPDYVPLLHQGWFRGIAGAMLATSQPSRDIDWRFLERRLVRGLPLEKLPWRSRATLKRGVQVLLDCSESMQPFRRDGTELVASLERLLGECRVRTWRFRLNSWQPARSQWKWLSPTPARFDAYTPMLLITDFGIAGSGATGLEPWLEVLDQAELLRCPILALIPAPESCWPLWLRRAVPGAFVWDRETSAQSVRREMFRSR
jgi:hypothetical protein